MKSQNPFNTGSPARGEGFFGRDEIIDDIITFLGKKHEFNFVIFGQRRIGKTSLLRKLQDDKKIRNLAYPVYFNLQDKAREQLPKLLYEIAGRIVADLELKLDIDEKNFLNEKGRDYFRDKFLPSVCSRLNNKGPLFLLFDEFDVLGDIEDVEDDERISSYAFRSFIPFMVNLLEEIQRKELPVKFIFAVGRNYKDLDPKRYGQVLKFGPQREISYFSEERTREFLKSFSIIPFETNAVDDLYLLTGGHPYFTQCLASAAFDSAEKNKAESISREMVIEAFLPTIKSFSSGILWVWDSLSAIDQIILYLMALLKEEGKPLTTAFIKEKALSLNFAPIIDELDQILEKLISFKFIREVNNKYDFYVEFIRKWIAQEVKEAEIATNLDGLDEEIQFQLHNGRYYYRHDEYKQAAEHYQNILKRSPYHFEALFYLARCYKNLIKEDEKYVEKSLAAYQRAFQINQRKSKKEYLDLLQEKRDYLEEQNLYNRLKPEGLEEIIKKITILKNHIAEMNMLREECDKRIIKKAKRFSNTVVFLGIPLLFLSVAGLEKNLVPRWMVVIFISLILILLIKALVIDHNLIHDANARKKKYLKAGYNHEDYLSLKEELEKLESY